MTSKEWEARLDENEPRCATDRPAPAWMPMARHMLFDLVSAETKLEDAVRLLEWTEDDDWWCEPGFTEERDAFLASMKRKP